MVRAAVLLLFPALVLLASAELDDSSCRDGVLSGNETGVDCGGPLCFPCADGEPCGTARVAALQRGGASMLALPCA